MTESIYIIAVCAHCTFPHRLEEEIVNSLIEKGQGFKCVNCGNGNKFKNHEGKPILKRVHK